MATSHPTSIPHEYASDDLLKDAYERGYAHGHGFACHNVPTIGKKYRTDGLGKVVADAKNVREIHESFCFEAEEHSRSYSPFEHTAKEFNENEEYSDDLWEAFDAGIAAAISADLSEYTDEDYGIEAEDKDDEDDNELG
jgi:hypothetical protein